VVEIEIVAAAQLWQQRMRSSRPLEASGGKIQSNCKQRIKIARFSIVRTLPKRKVFAKSHNYEHSLSAKGAGAREISDERGSAIYSEANTTTIGQCGVSTTRVSNRCRG
jgi:hypothetical protein